MALTVQPMFIPTLWTSFESCHWQRQIRKDVEIDLTVVGVIETCDLENQ